MVALLAVLAAALVALAIWSAVRPYDALVVLLALLIFHSGATHVLENVVRVDATVLVLLSAWKEAIVAGLVVAALRRLRHGGIRARVSPAALAALLLALIAARVAVDLVGHVGFADALFGARNAAEFAVLFLVVSVLAPDVAWLRRTSLTLVPLVFVAAEAGIVQTLFGLRLYDLLYHLPGEHLTSAFTAKLGGLTLPRAVGTYTAPNEFGLGLAVYLFAIILPLALGRPARLVRLALALCGAAVVVALVLTYSRSAWVGAAAGALVVAAALGAPGWAWLRRRWASGAAIDRRIALGLAGAAALVVAVFVVSGAGRFLVATLTGQEASAAGRPSSLGGGVRALLEHPLGAGLIAAGPKALAINKSAVLTENWYLVYGIQLGWLALACLVGFAGLCLGALLTRTRSAIRLSGRPSERVAFQLGAAAALVAALTSALFIPALLDLPASLTLWTFAAATLAPDAALAVAPSPTEELSPPPVRGVVRARP